MSFVKVKNIGLLLDEPQTYITADTASGSGTITVKNITGFAINQILLIGFLGNQGAEIIKTHSSTAPSGSTITLASNTVFPHGVSTTVTAMAYDQVEISTATTSSGSKTVLTTISVVANSDYTIYNDSANSSGYYFARFKNSITSVFSAYSDPIPVSGYTTISARSVIDSALREINKGTSDILSDIFEFEQIDNCQTEVVRELKRWSWMQKFDQDIGQLSTGDWRIALPSDCDDQNTTKSIYNLRIGRGSNLTWVDKEKWNQLISDVSYTTLALNISLNDTSITLTDSSNFDDTGTVYIGGNSYSFTANDRTANVLTITASTTTNTAGQYAFQGATTGTPKYFTVFGGYAYFWPILDSTINGRDAIMDYYSALIRTTTDTQALVVPDPTLVQYYLQWKSMLRLNNGEPTMGSDQKYDLYKSRLDTLKRKESINRTFQLRPLQNRFRVSSDDPAVVRLGNFIVNQ